MTGVISYTPRTHDTHSCHGKCGLDLLTTDSTSMAHNVADELQALMHHLLLDPWSTFFCSPIAHPCQVLHDQLAGLGLASTTLTTDLQSTDSALKLASSSSPFEMWAIVPEHYRVRHLTAEPGDTHTYACLHSDSCKLA